MNILRAHIWPLAAAIVAGFVLLPLVFREYSDWNAKRAAENQRATPVVQMSGAIRSRGEDWVMLHIFGRRLRGEDECRFSGIMASSIDAAGVKHLANIERVDDVGVQYRTLSIGYWDIGTWRVWPIIPGAVSVTVEVDHACYGVIVRSVIAKVVL